MNEENIGNCSVTDTCSVMGSDATHHQGLPKLPNFSREGRGQGKK
jgi:hypothetical protein